MEIATTVLRLLMLLGHLAALAVALNAIMREDYNLLVRRRIDPSAIRETSRIVFWSLLALAATGSAIIGIDTGFDIGVIATKSKVLAKLTVVGILTLNGVIIHVAAFPAFRSRKSLVKFVPMLSVLASISAVSWFYAAFLGIAKPLAGMLGYSGFMAVYAILLVGGILSSQLAVRPLLSKLKVVYPPAGQKPETVMKRLVKRFRNDRQIDMPTTILYPM
jgi:hypothetical protein